MAASDAVLAGMALGTVGALVPDKPPGKSITTFHFFIHHINPAACILLIVKEDNIDNSHRLPALHHKGQPQLVLRSFITMSP